MSDSPTEIHRIEINFPCAVDLPPGFDHVLMALADAICSAWELAHPGHVMWASGVGAKPIWREPEEPDFDDSVFCIDCATREETLEEKTKRERRAERIAKILSAIKTDPVAAGKELAESLVRNAAIASEIATTIQKAAAGLSRFLVAYQDVGAPQTQPGMASWTIVAEPFDTLEEAMSIPNPQNGWGILHVVGDMIRVVRLRTSDGWIEELSIPETPTDTMH